MMLLCTKCGANRANENGPCTMCGHYTLDPPIKMSSKDYNGFRIRRLSGASKDGDYYIKCVSNGNKYLSHNLTLDAIAVDAWYKTIEIAMETIDKYNNKYNIKYNNMKQKLLNVMPMKLTRGQRVLLHNKTDNHWKFYEIFYEYNNYNWYYLAKYGRIGKDGVMQQKNYSSELAARSATMKKISEKLAKGYIIVDVINPVDKSIIVEKGVDMTVVETKPPTKPPNEDLSGAFNADMEITL